MINKIIDNFRCLEKEQEKFSINHKEKINRMQRKIQKSELEHKDFAIKVQKSISRYSK